MSWGEGERKRYGGGGAQVEPHAQSESIALSRELPGDHSNIEVPSPLSHRSRRKLPRQRSVSCGPQSHTAIAGKISCFCLSLLLTLSMVDLSLPRSVITFLCEPNHPTRLSEAFQFFAPRCLRLPAMQRESLHLDTNTESPEAQACTSAAHHVGWRSLDCAAEPHGPPRPCAFSNRASVSCLGSPPSPGIWCR